MLTNPLSKMFVILAVLAAALVTISFVNQSVPAKAEVGRPVMAQRISLPGISDLSDYFLRHATSGGIPVTGANELSDYYQRLPKEIPSTVAAEGSDFALRHPEWNVRVGAAADLSDYALRHPEINERTSSITDLSDYALRHPASSKSSGAVDTSDYFLRH